MRCAICLHDIDDARRACNAQPVANGQCCPACDDLIVTPVRLARTGMAIEHAVSCALSIHKSAKTLRRT